MSVKKDEREPEEKWLVKAYCKVEEYRRRA
jgi:hypothetical protein